MRPSAHPPLHPAAVITELDIARSLLANQRHQEMQALEAAEGRGARRGAGEPDYSQQLVAFPVRYGSLQFVAEVRAGACGGCLVHLVCRAVLLRFRMCSEMPQGTVVRCCSCCRCAQLALPWLGSPLNHLPPVRNCSAG